MHACLHTHTHVHTRHTHQAYTPATIRKRAPPGQLYTSCSLPRQSLGECSKAWLHLLLCISFCVTPSEVEVTLKHKHWPSIGEDPFINLTFLCALYCFACFWDWLRRPRNSFKRTQKTFKSKRKGAKHENQTIISNSQSIA